MTWQLVVALLSVAALLGVTLAVRKLGTVGGWSAETQRKAVHVGVGVHAMLLPLVMDRSGFGIFAVLALAALLFLRIPMIASAGPGAAIHSVARRSWGDVLFLAAVAILFLRSAGSIELYVLPLAVLTMADSAAALIGTGYGRRHFGTTDRIKSAEGTATFFVVTWMLTVGILTLMTAVPRSDIIWLATVISAMTALVEADSWHGLDNIFIPLAVHVLLVSLDQSSAWFLGGISMLWLGVLVGAGHIGKWLGMAPHAVRATFIVLALTAGLVSPQEMIFPVAAFALHLTVRRFAEPGVAMDDADFVLVLFLVGIAWMTVGAMSHTNVSAFYAMTFAAVGAGYTTLAVPRHLAHLRDAVAVAVGVAMVAAYAWFVTDLALGAPRMSAAAAVAVCFAATSACVLVARHHWLPRRRSPCRDLVALASMFPVAAFGVFTL